MRDWLDRLRGGRGGPGSAGISGGSDDASAPYAPPDRQRRLTGNPAMLGAMVVLAVAVLVFVVALAIR